ncbi:MAG: helix-turn-helix domain-containing protein [Nocardioides sp.]|jgi:AcrR family transcriptional regulator
MPPPTDGRRVAAATRRKERERALLDATRRLFDQRGMGEAQIEDIANEVGINRALVYRHFTGKEELFEPPRRVRRLGLVAQPVGVSSFLAA